MNKLIYCLDDEESIRTLYEEALPLGGFCCKTFADASSFYKALKEKKPDLALLDIMLPDMNGMDILRLMKQGEFASIPVIFVSAKGSETDKVKGLNEGADDYLSKPFGVMELIARINANLRKSSKSDTASYKGLEVNDALHEIKLNDELLSLSNKEYDLLSYLLFHQSVLISKEELLKEIWGIDADIETRTLDMFVSRIRKKIASSSANIETVRGIGYILK